MGKRSTFERRPQDLYETTDPKAIAPLLPFLGDTVRYHEPCAGNGALIEQLHAHNHICCGTGDLGQDARYLRYCAGDMFITNPPWTRPVLHDIIVNLSKLAPTWLLFDADWMHTKQATPYLRRCRKIVSVGRVKWFRGTKFTGKDNCAWYLFGAPSDVSGGISFYGRT